MNSPDFSRLSAAGLNLQAIFDLAQLPDGLRRSLDPSGQFRQLILLGHGGKTLWAAVQAAGLVSADPIDEFTVRSVEQWLAAEAGGHRHAIVYPGGQAVGLQALGELAGWHHPSPFMVGINQTWGSWYAYRALVLTDTTFAPTSLRRDPSPCASCQDRPCVAACPGGALTPDGFKLDKCIAYRRQPASLCRASCQSRLACPVRPEHRYCAEQLEHSYSISLRMIEQIY